MQNPPTGFYDRSTLCTKRGTNCIFTYDADYIWYSTGCCAKIWRYIWK